MRAKDVEPNEIHTRSTLLRTKRPGGPKAFRNGQTWAKDGKGRQFDPFRVDEQVSRALQTLRR